MAFNTIIQVLAISEDSPLPLSIEKRKKIDEFCSQNAAKLVFTESEDQASSFGPGLDKTALAQLPEQFRKWLESASAINKSVSSASCTVSEKETLTTVSLACIRASTAIINKTYKDITLLTDLDKITIKLNSLLGIPASGKAAANILRLLVREEKGSSALYGNEGIMHLVKTTKIIGQFLKYLSKIESFNSFVDNTVIKELLTFQKETFMILVNLVKISPINGKYAVENDILLSIELLINEPPLLNSPNKLNEMTIETCFIASRCLFLILGTATDVNTLDSINKTGKPDYLTQLTRLLLGDYKTLESSMENLNIKEKGNETLENKDYIEIISLSLNPFLINLNKIIENYERKYESNDIKKDLDKEFGLNFPSIEWEAIQGTDYSVKVIDELFMSIFSILNFNKLISNKEDKIKIAKSLKRLIFTSISLLVQTSTSIISTLEIPFRNVINFLMNIPYEEFHHDDLTDILIPEDECIYYKSNFDILNNSNTNGNGNKSYIFIDKLLNVLDSILKVGDLLNETDKAGNMKYSSQLSIIELSYIQLLTKSNIANVSTKILKPNSTGQSIETQLSSLLILLHKLVSYNEDIKDRIKEKLFPKDFVKSDLAMNQIDSITGRSIKLMSSPVILQTSKNCIGNLILELFDKNTSDMINFCGYGNCIGYFMNCGIEIPNINDVISNSNSTGFKINPITGSVIDENEQEKLKKEWEALTDEEREKEAEKLFILFDKINQNGIFKVGFKNPPPS